MRFLRAASWAIEPTIGAVFLLLWIVAEIGRGVTGIGMMVAFAVAIGLSRIVPVASIVILPATVLLQAVHVLHYPDSTDWPVYLGIAITVGLVAAHARRGVLIAALPSGVVSVLGGAALMVFQQPWGWLSWTGRTDWGPGGSAWSEYLFLASIGVVTVGLAWGAGLAFNLSGRLLVARAIQGRISGRLKQSEVELAVAQERNRIAQEMHDVLAHSLAVIVAQADGARYVRSSRPAAIDESLGKIADAARAALVDVRGIIDGILDGSVPPQPGVDDLAELVASVGTAGISVTLTHAGDRGELAPGQQLAVYRIVQEALTNALRHRGRGSTMLLVLDWRGPGLSLQCASTGGDDVSALDDESRPRRGVEGMRERARLAGGWLAAGADENGDYRVTAFVPYRLPVGDVVRVLGAVAA